MVQTLALLSLVRHLHPMRRYINHGGLGVGITPLMRKGEVLFCLAPVLFRIHSTSPTLVLTMTHKVVGQSIADRLLAEARCYCDPLSVAGAHVTGSVRRSEG